MQTTIYLADVRPINDQRVFERLYAAASTERKAKVDRYRYQKNRLQSLCAESLLQHALRSFGYDPAVAYRYGKYGKPYLPDAVGFYFNLSHSGDYAMLAVSDTEIGCDIEQIRPVSRRLFERVLTPEESEVLLSYAEAERNELFFRFWVAKESYMKACGSGLATDPASIRISLDPPACAVGSASPEAFAIREGAFPGYRFAVCREAPMPDVQTEFIQFETISRDR